MIIIELDYILVYHIEGKEESHTCSIEKGKVPYVRKEYAVEYITKKQYEDYNRLRRLSAY
jgi:hypothetical protein